MVDAATEHSYAKSAQIVTGGVVSRQTVRNQILKIHVPELKPAVKNKGVKELHVFADEDHVHMQRPNKEKGKKGQIVPLVTVTEGINMEGNRHYTENPMSFVNEEFDTKNLWKTVSGYIGEHTRRRVWRDLFTCRRRNMDQERSGEYSQTVHVIACDRRIPH